MIIGIPMKNRYELTEAVLNQLRPEIAEDQTSYVVIVDNGSDEAESIAWLDEVEDGERVVVLRDPDGGIHDMWNAVLDMGAHDGAEVAVLLNNDVRLGDDFLAGLQAALEYDERLWAVCPNYDGREIQAPVAPAREICAGRYDGTGGFAGFAFALRLDTAYRFPTELRWWGGDNHLVASAWANDGWVGIARDVTCEHLDGGSKTLLTVDEKELGLDEDLEKLRRMGEPGGIPVDRVDGPMSAALRCAGMDDLELAYRTLLEQESDIRWHLPLLHDLTCELDAQGVIELGVRSGISSVAFLWALRQTGGHLWSVDPGPLPDWGHALGGSRWTYVQGLDDNLGVLAHLPPYADIVFVDTDHTAELTRREIRLYRGRAQVMVFHDTAVKEFPHHQAPGYGKQPDFPVRTAIEEELDGVKVDYFEHCNGLAVAWVGAQ
jgi:hypothetical protein